MKKKHERNSILIIISIIILAVLISYGCERDLTKLDIQKNDSNSVEENINTLSAARNNMDIKLLDNDFPGTLVSKVDAVSVKTTIQNLQDFKTRWVDAPNSKKVVEYLYSRFKMYNLEVKYDEFITKLNHKKIAVLPKTNKIWAAGAGGIILYSTDMGQNWTTQQKDICSFINQIFFVDEL